METNVMTETKIKKRPFDTFRTVLSGVKIPWIFALISLVSSFLMANAMIGSAVITAKVVDSNGNINTADILKYIGMLLGGGLLACIGNYCNTLLSERINIGVRSKLWKKMLRLPMRFYDQESGETLVSRITVDCSRASAFIGVVIMTIASMYGLYLAVKSMLEFSKTLTLWSICLVPVVAVGVWLSGKLVFKAQNRLYKTHADATAYLIERVKNLRLVRTSNMVQKETAFGTNRFKAMFGATVRAMLADDLMASFIGLTPIALIIITFIVGSILYAKGDISLGEVIGFYTVSSMASIRINALITAYGDLVSANGTFDKISHVLKAEEESTDGIPLEFPDESVTFENVDFSYGEKKVFENLSCVIPAHRVTAIIGPNGTGKSTLFKLLERIYDPNGGEMRFGTRNARDFNSVSWRSAFALVSQDRPLISGTIRENITYGCTRSISEDELNEVARQAGLTELIASLPDGFDTRVEANGMNFSGGQRQCIAIARAIMRNPDYLLLDEATSNLDAQSEKQVSEALANLMKGRTTVMIAHSLSAITHADNIIVLKDGRMEACGTPDEVAKTSPSFREFVESQAFEKAGVTI